MSVTAAPGFVAAGIACGIKESGASDLALVATDDGAPVSAAAVFTANKAKAAPVQVTAAHLAATDGRAAAVVLNSGNANAATGADGREKAERTTALVAAELGCDAAHVLVCSTGLIGIPLPMDPIEKGVAPLCAARHAHGGSHAAEAIMTTDTYPKQVVVVEGGITVGGMAKGAAMLAPNMATMLAVLTTNAAVEPDRLQALLRHAVAVSFNTLSVDGCTSTNDTVIVLANGRADVGPVDDDVLGEALVRACYDLAAQMAGDAEGATKVVRVTVAGAPSDADAAAAARKVAQSQLVKCSFYGEDPYWGRVVSELGSAGTPFDPDKVSVAYDGIAVCRDGIAASHDPAAVKAHLARRHVHLDVDLGLGTGRATVLTNDLTHAYIDENMRTS